VASDDWGDQLHRTQCPTLVVVPIGSTANYEPFRRHVRDVEMRVYEGAAQHLRRLPRSLRRRRARFPRPPLRHCIPGRRGPPISIFESGAILIYLGVKTGKFWPADLRREVPVLEWLMWQMSGFGPIPGSGSLFPAGRQRAGPALWPRNLGPAGQHQDDASRRARRLVRTSHDQHKIGRFEHRGEDVATGNSIPAIRPSPLIIAMAVERLQQPGNEILSQGSVQCELGPGWLSHPVRSPSAMSAVFVFRRQTPHADAAKTSCIADRGGEGRRRNFPHRGQDDRKPEVQPLGQRI
jgi:hypothetical protein